MRGICLERGWNYDRLRLRALHRDHGPELARIVWKLRGTWMCDSVKLARWLRARAER